MNPIYKFILAVGILIMATLIGIGLYLWLSPYFKVAPAENNAVPMTTDNQIAATSTASSTTDASSSKTNTANQGGTTKPTAPKALTYSDAVNKYINKRLQFDANCAMTPNFVVYKKGTAIMLDNRSGQARPIYLDGIRHNLAAFGFKIVTLTTTAAMPHTVRVDCGTGKNNGQIILE